MISKAALAGAGATVIAYMGGLFRPDLEHRTNIELAQEARGTFQGTSPIHFEALDKTMAPISEIPGASPFNKLIGLSNTALEKVAYFKSTSSTGTISQESYCSIEPGQLTTGQTYRLFMPALENNEVASCNLYRMGASVSLTNFETTTLILGHLGVFIAATAGAYFIGAYIKNTLELRKNRKISLQQ